MTYVLTGTDAVSRLVKTYEYDYSTIFNRPKYPSTPYYFKCKDAIYLAISVDSISKANAVISHWSRTRRVAGVDETLPNTNDTYKVVVFVDVDNISEITRRVDDVVEDQDVEDSTEAGIILMMDPVKRSNEYLALLKI
jgi:hypothetical protein